MFVMLCEVYLRCLLKLSYIVKDVGTKWSFPSIRPVIHPSKAKGGGGLFKLQNSVVSGNCPFCPISSRLGIHLVMKGYWPIIKNLGRHWEGSICNQCSQFFSFLGFGVRGKGRFLFFVSIGSGGLVIHPWDPGRNKYPPSAHVLLSRKGMHGRGRGVICCYLTGHKQCKHQDFQRPGSRWIHAECDI